MRHAYIHVRYLTGATRPGYQMFWVRNIKQCNLDNQQERMGGLAFFTEMPSRILTDVHRTFGETYCFLFQGFENTGEIFRVP